VVELTAILTCHNRRELTLRCLRTFFAQQLEGREVRLSAVVVDDGSSDGTGKTVKQDFPAVEVVLGTGSLFWAKGMAVAERRARLGSPDFLLWLNDDVELGSHGVAVLLDVAESAGRRAIVVGALSSPTGDQVTYSGVRRTGLHPLRFERVVPCGKPVACDTFNGNAVLVPRDVYEQVGGIDAAFAHSEADFDYGLRARALGFEVLVAPVLVGTCARPAVNRPWRDPETPVRERWRSLVGPKGLPPRSRARYLRRHGGPVWPLFWLAPYVRAALPLARSSHLGGIEAMTRSGGSRDR
jgi:GT2 family glycosyltransferase